MQFLIDFSIEFFDQFLIDKIHIIIFGSYALNGLKSIFFVFLELIHNLYTQVQKTYGFAFQLIFQADKIVA